MARVWLDKKRSSRVIRHQRRVFSPVRPFLVSASGVSATLAIPGVTLQKQKARHLHSSDRFLRRLHTRHGATYKRTRPTLTITPTHHQRLEGCGHQSTISLRDSTTSSSKRKRGRDTHQAAPASPSSCPPSPSLPPARSLKRQKQQRQPPQQQFEYHGVDEWTTDSSSLKLDMENQPPSNRPSSIRPHPHAGSDSIKQEASMLHHDDDTMGDAGFVLDKKDLLIVKDGTIRVAESMGDQPMVDANGEAIKAAGTWTKAEHERFLQAMDTYPKGPWKAIAAMVGTRTVRQTQTHAQKYREKIARRMRGLRNRNGTLQYPPASGLYDDRDELTHLTAGPASASSALGGGSFTAELTGHAPASATSASAPASFTALHTGSVMDFHQLSEASISRAFLDNEAFPSTWEESDDHRTQTQLLDFEASMDFLMSVYSANPSQLGGATLLDEEE